MSRVSIGGVLVDPVPFLEPLHDASAGAAEPMRPPADVAGRGVSPSARRSLDRASSRRRERSGVAALVVLFAAAVMAVAAVVGTATTADATPTDRVWVVEPGDTMWGIARSLQPDGDVRPLVADLVRVNGFSAIHAGDRVVLPDRN